MREVLTGVTFLVLIIMILRWLSMGRVSMCFRYSLWLMVVLRLMIPTSLGNSPFSIMNLTVGWPDPMTMAEELFRSDEPESGRKDLTAAGEEMIRNTESGPQAKEESGMTGGTQDDAVKNTGDFSGAEYAKLTDGNGRMRDGMRFGRKFMVSLWMTGMLAVGGYMLICQMRFVRYLHHARREAPEENLPGDWRRRLEKRRMRVYLVEGLPSPCLVGRDIYMEPQILREKDRLRHILAHEYVHAVQGDPVWAFVRSALCAVYWFCPFVWIAALESKKDSELACDERAIRMLGDSQRYAYGRTLLDLLSGRDGRTGYAGTVLIMGGRERSVKERIFMIAEKRRGNKKTVFFVALTALLVCGCAFTGAETAGKGKKILLTNPASSETEGMEGPEEAGEEKEDAARRQQEQVEQDVAEATALMEETRRQQEQFEQEIADVTASVKEKMDFEKELNLAQDSALASAETVDMSAYYDYLYKGAACPMTDGQWYELVQEGDSRIAFYGLYTEGYGCRGMKIKIGDDVNTFDQPWLPTLFPLEAAVLEESDTDGMPRSFVFTMCVVNTNDSEIWRLYVADRYDTGTIQLSCFEDDARRRLLEGQKVELHVDREEEKVNLIREEGASIGSIDISGYEEEEVDEAVWDEGSAAYILEEEGDVRISLVRGIGLKTADGSDVLYGGLSLIEYPVEIGSFGERKFTLGTPKVGNYVSGRINSTK